MMKMQSPGKVGKKSFILQGCLIFLIGNRMNSEKEIIPEKTAWYDKESILFSDLIRIIRTHLWRDSLFLRKGSSEGSEEIQLSDDDHWRDWVIESLARAA